MWSWHSFEDQSSERRGPGTETEQPVTNVRSRRAELKSVRNWIEKKSGVRMELKITGILRAGCFLLHGLPKEYNARSDSPIHE